MSDEIDSQLPEDYEPLSEEPDTKLNDTGRSLAALNGAAVIAITTLLSVPHISLVLLKCAGGSFLIGLLVAIWGWIAGQASEMNIANSLLRAKEGRRTRQKTFDAIRINGLRAIQAYVVSALLFVAGIGLTYVAALYVW